VRSLRERALPLVEEGGSCFMLKAVGAAVGAAIVLLFLSSVASHLSWLPLEF
jgi:hypothetical protein